MGSPTYISYLSQLREKGEEAKKSQEVIEKQRNEERSEKLVTSLLGVYRTLILVQGRRGLSELSPIEERQYQEFHEGILRNTFQENAELLKEKQIQLEALQQERDPDEKMLRGPFWPSLKSFRFPKENPASSNVIIETDGVRRCWSLPNLLTPTECDEIIKLSDEKQYEIAETFCHNYQTRLNDRLIAEDPDLSNEILNRVRAHLPEKITHENSVWQLASINSRWRFCKYFPGHYFGAHLDGMYIKNPSERSLLTIMVYLNSQAEKSQSKEPQTDGYTGGSTLFLNGDYLPVKEVIPRTGLGLIFYQESSDLLHEGAPLLTGTKYIMRSDVMYVKVDSKDLKEDSKSTVAKPTSSTTKGAIALIGAVVLGIGVFIGYRILQNRSARTVHSIPSKRISVY